MDLGKRVLDFYFLRPYPKYTTPPVGPFVLDGRTPLQCECVINFFNCIINFIELYSHKH